MPEGPILRKPPQVGPVQLPDGGPPNGLERFLSGLLGDQAPGDAASALGAMAGLIPLDRLIARLKAARGLKQLPITSPTNTGDQMLREHVIGSPRLREFQTMKEADLVNAGGAGKDPLEAAYERILNSGGKAKVSPPGSGPKVEQPAVSWPNPEDIDKLKTKYAGQPSPKPTRRKLFSGRTLDPSTGPKK